MDQKITHSFSTCSKYKMGETYYLQTIGLKLPSLPRLHLHIRGIKNQVVIELPDQELLFKPNRYLIEVTLNAMNSTRSQICPLNILSLKNILSSADDELILLLLHFKYLQWYKEAKCLDMSL